MVHPLLLSKVCQQGTGSELEQPGYQPAPIGLLVLQVSALYIIPQCQHLPVFKPSLLIMNGQSYIKREWKTLVRARMDACQLGWTVVATSECQDWGWAISVWGAAPAGTCQIYSWEPAWQENFGNPLARPQVPLVSGRARSLNRSYQAELQHLLAKV